MTPSERLNAFLLIALFVVFTAGYVVGSSRIEPAASPYPVNWDPEKSVLTSSLRSCQELIAHACAPTKEVAH